MALTMLQANRNRKPKKKKDKQQFQQQVNGKVKRMAKHVKIVLAMYGLEYFISIHDAMDIVEDHFPDIAESIRPELDEIDQMEAEWGKKFKVQFPLDRDRNNLRTFTSNHFYKKQLVDWRNKIYKTVGMRAVRNHYTKPNLIGVILLLEIAMKILDMQTKRQTRDLCAAIKMYGIDIKLAEEATRIEILQSSVEDFTGVVNRLLDKFANIMGMDDKTVEEYCTYQKIAEMVYDYSVAYYDAYLTADIKATNELINKEENDGN